MTIPLKLPTWATDTGNSDIVEPADALKIVGWAADDRPPAGWLNWWQNMVYQWVAWIAHVQAKNWKYVHSANANDELQDVCYGLGEWIVVGTTAGNSLQTSNSADVFSAVANPSGDSLNAVAANSTTAAAVGVDGTLICSNNVAAEWYDVTGMLPRSGDYLSIAYGNGLWVASHEEGYIYWTVDCDGPWTEVETPQSDVSYPVYCVRWFEALGLWIAVGVGTSSVSGIITAP